MSLIHIPAFSGLNITAAPQRIREDEATVAIGCDFRSLDLRPFKGDAWTGGGMDLTGIDATGASIYQFDATHWIGILGDKNFARSPTFFSDATTGQRVFVTDNGSPTGSDWDWDWVREVTLSDLVEWDGYANSYKIGNSTKRLGVPKPQAINMGRVSWVKRSGTITGMTRSSNANTTITVDSGSAAVLKAGDKIDLDIPAIGPGPFTIINKTSDTTPVFTLSNTRLRQIGMTYTTKNGKTDVAFVRNNHGLVDGTQILLKGGTAGFNPAKLPSTWKTELYRVDVTDYNQVKLWRYAEDKYLELTSNAEADGTAQVYFYLVAEADDTMESGWGTITAANWYTRSIPYTPPAGSTATWEIALDSLTERSYCATFVNEFGDESEPCDPTKAILVAQGDPVTFTQDGIDFIGGVGGGPYTAIPTGAAAYAGDLKDNVDITDYRTPVEVRLYRTDGAGTFRLVTTGVDDARKITWTEAATQGFTFVDSYEDSELGEPLSTTGWQIPPKDLNGVLITPGGSLVGYKSRSVLGSVPYAPYAFPLANRVAFDWEVQGLVSTSSGIVVVTKGMPALIVGDDPGTWSIQKLEYPYGCASRRSIVDMGEMAIYASADGLVGISGASVELLTKGVLTKAQWQVLYNPINIKAAHVEGRYYAITQLNDNTRKAFMYDPWTKTFVDLTVGTPYPVALHNALDTDTLLILKSDGKAYEWNKGNEWVPYMWRSKYFQLTRPDILGCCQVIATLDMTGLDFTMRLLCWDGEAVTTVAAYTNIAGGVASLQPADGTAWEGGVARRYAFSKNVNPFRLPIPSNRYTVYQVEVAGKLPIGQISLASVMDELKSV